jgi:hydrogenase nickel incorporation protein HypA/HybF
MHELALAQAIVAVAERHARGGHVEKVEVKVGRLRQVVPTALEFAFELVTEGTALAGARLEIEQVPAWILCRACGAESPAAEFPFACAVCGGVDVEVTAGEELQVEALEVLEGPMAARA